jgi:hypothetical protein
MNNTIVRGTVVGADVVATAPNDLVRKVLRLAGGARVLLVQHGERMENDPGYRESFENLVSLVSEREGPVGNNVQLVAAIQAFLAKMLR